MPLSPRDQLLKDFSFTIELALREALKPVGIRKQLTDQQMKIMSETVMKHILRSNWIVRQGKPSGFTQEHNPIELDRLSIL
jgi:hypothetical protein